MGNTRAANAIRDKIAGRKDDIQQRFDNDIATRELVAKERQLAGLERSQVESQIQAEVERKVAENPNVSRSTIENEVRSRRQPTPPAPTPNFNAFPNSPSPFDNSPRNPAPKFTLTPEDISGPITTAPQPRTLQQILVEEVDLNRRLAALDDAPSLDELVDAFAQNPTSEAARIIQKKFPTIFTDTALKKRMEFLLPASQQSFFDSIGSFIGRSPRALGELVGLKIGVSDEDRRKSRQAINTARAFLRSR